MMASIIMETTDKPWEYYRDMTRQLWDEARHAMMGEVGFAHLDIDWPHQVMINHTWSLALNTQLKPIERHAVLYFIEQGLMPRPASVTNGRWASLRRTRFRGCFRITIGPTRCSTPASAATGI